jgi:deazaflavin-dependent oxidoreductase (nitroreductase family)
VDRGGVGEAGLNLTAVRAALAIDRSSSAWERTVDITTTGARTGRPRRIEIWFYRHEGTVYLSGLPGRRDWYANLLAHPEFTFHLKSGVRADLPARAIPVTDPERRLAAFTEFTEDMNQPHDPARIRRRTSVGEWLVGSPLMEVVFSDADLP